MSERVQVVQILLTVQHAQLMGATVLLAVQVGLVVPPYCQLHVHVTAEAQISGNLVLLGVHVVH